MLKKIYFKNVLITTSLILCLSCESSFEIAALSCDKLVTDDAISKCKEAKQNNEESHLYLAAKKLSKGAEFDSLNELEQATKEDPDSTVALYRKALTLGRIGDHTKAIEAFNEVIRIDKKNQYSHQAYFYKAAALRDLHKYDEAVTSYIQALKIKPAYAIAHYELGKLYDKLNKTAEATDSFLKAYELWNGQVERSPNFFLDKPEIKKAYLEIKHHLKTKGILSEEVRGLF